MTRRAPGAGASRGTAGAVLAATLGCLAVLLPGGVPALAGSMTDQELRGRQIYFEGKGGSDGEIAAEIGEADMVLPATALPCSNCHGDDGLGRPEGGVRPSNIVWANLTKPYGHRHHEGRQHPAFDEAGVASAIADGVDPAGNRLDSSMPRYRMSDADMAALTAYLKRLEGDLGPGLSAKSIRIGTILPLSGQLAPLGRTMEAITRAYFDDLNAAGGIYGRNLELVVAAAGDRDTTLENARRLVEDDEVFAVTGIFSAGMEDELFAYFEESGIPDIGPFTLFGGGGAFSGSGTFFLMSGLAEQTRALVDYAALKLEQKAPGVGIVLPPGERVAHLPAVIERQGRGHGWASPMVVAAPRDAAEMAKHVAELRQAGVQVLFYFGEGDRIDDFAREAAALSWYPFLLLSGLNVDRAVFDIPRAFDQRLFLAYPTLPSDRTAAGADEYEELRVKYGLPQQPPIAGAFVLASSKLLVEGLRGAGKSLSREKLLAALETLDRFETGFTPAVSFDRSHRVGARGAYVLPVNLERRSVRPPAMWIPVTDYIAGAPPD